MENADFFFKPAGKIETFLGNQHQQFLIIAEAGLQERTRGAGVLQRVKQHLRRT